MTLEEAATGPFAQFQNSPDEEDAITTLVLQLIRRHPQAAPREEAVRRQVQAFRESVAAVLKGRKTAPTPSPARVDETSVAKFFEEVKVLVRDVPERVASELGPDREIRRMRKHRRLHPMMFEELLHHPMIKELPETAGVPILIVFSVLRDDFPWLYELGVQLYHAIEEGSPRAIERARRTIMATIEMTGRGMFREMMGGPDDEEAMMFLHHFVHDIDRFVQRTRRPRKPEPESAVKE